MDQDSKSEETYFTFEKGKQEVLSNKSFSENKESINSQNDNSVKEENSSEGEFQKNSGDIVSNMNGDMEIKIFRNKQELESNNKIKYRFAYF